MEGSIAAVFLNIPSFIRFIICETHFKLTHISNENTRFHQVLMVLPSELISNLPSAINGLKKYTEVKNAVVTIHERTRPAKLIGNTQMTERLSLINGDGEQSWYKR